MNDDDTEDGRTIRPFADWLREQRTGSLHNELSEAMQEVSAAVIQHRKKGKIVISIDVGPMNNGTMVVVTDEVKLTIPTADRGAAYFYLDADDNLRREDPNQLKFESLQQVPTAEGDLVSVDTATGEVVELPR